ncbi:PREDICTED: uncharacterized protein LOC105108900 [Populus euphratica]|uniref:Uncharacterized protein LOC105108900 n=1 Tax=Populus euphratica TaxID=75702 RepID=A0AAJ6SZ89_POPEU|nr:PREDICTED: uncharacterized protein LOC105108900 [Populus euphratica]
MTQFFSTKSNFDLVLAIASGSPTADTFLEKLNPKSRPVAQEIFSSWFYKTEHFQKVHTSTGLPFSTMLFSDDEERNIESISNMGVTSILVKDGIRLGAQR